MCGYKFKGIILFAPFLLHLMSFSKLILKNTVVQRYSNTFEGPLVTKHRGERAPNGLTWVHSPSDLFHVDGIPGQHEAIWSRSMIKEFLDTHPNVDLEPPFEASDRGDLQPRRLKPWSVLNIPKSPGSDVEEWCVNGSHAAPSPNGVGKADDLGTLSMCSKEQGDNDTVVLSAAPSPQQQDHTEVAMQNGEGVTGGCPFATSDAPIGANNGIQRQRSLLLPCPTKVPRQQTQTTPME
jgi:hypothetical protein